MVALRLPWIKNYKHYIASFVETKKDLKAFVGLVFSPTTFGRSDELFHSSTCAYLPRPQTFVHTSWALHLMPLT